MPHESLPLEDCVVVSTLVGEHITVYRIFRGCVVVCQSYGFAADLLPLRMIELDLILGMDWLYEHFAVIDCRRRLVIFSLPGSPEIVFVRDKFMTTSVISYIRANRLMAKGC